MRSGYAMQCPVSPSTWMYHRRRTCGRSEGMSESGCVELSAEQQARVRQVLREDADVDGLRTPEELHYAAVRLDWDGDIEKLHRIVADPRCDRGTALAVYWMSEPVEYFAGCATREDAERLFGPGSPRHDTLAHPRGTDWTRGWDAPGRARAIPPVMVEACPGRATRSDIFF
jgi:hypothetical protein